MIEIGGRAIGVDQEPFIIAEMSGNHNQSLDRALEIVRAAAESGAHAVKLQTYTADTMTIDADRPDFRINDPESLWAGRSLYDLYTEASTPWDWHEPLFEQARKLGLLIFSTPFDETAVDFLEALEVPAYKIASFENTDVSLIRAVAATGKPVIISTGMASESEIADAVNAAREAGCRDLILLRCTSSYPAAPSDIHLRSIPRLGEQFDCEVGLSDHTLGVGVAVSAVALGATVIEKHFTLSRAEGGVDSAFSLEPQELADLVQETRRGWQALGGVQFGPTRREESSLKFRRSLYIVRDLKAGDTLDRSSVRAIRPGYGLAPKHLEEVVGRRVAADAPRGTRLTWELLRS